MTDELTPSLAPPRSPFNVRCEACTHVWTAAWLPMEAGLFARLTARLFCPSCGRGGVAIKVATSAPVSPVPPQRTA